MTNTPLIAPYDSCIGCFRGDVDTAVAFRGEAEFIMAGLHVMCGIPEDQSEALVHMYAREDLGCEPGMVPGGEFTMIVQLCQECADRTGAHKTRAPVGTFDAIPVVLPAEANG
jgi:hypothetical protein